MLDELHEAGDELAPGPQPAGQLPVPERGRPTSSRATTPTPRSGPRSTSTTSSPAAAASPPIGSRRSSSPTPVEVLTDVQKCLQSGNIASKACKKVLADLDSLNKLKQQCKKPKYKNNPVCVVLNTVPDVPLDELPDVLDDILDGVLGRSLTSWLGDGTPSPAADDPRAVRGCAHEPRHQGPARRLRRPSRRRHRLHHASYLGFIDQVLGAGMTVHATLPVVRRALRGQRGLLPRREDRQGHARWTPAATASSSSWRSRRAPSCPATPPMYVHNLSAVGEQYLDFEPRTTRGPYAEDGDRSPGDADSLPSTRPTCWSSSTTSSARSTRRTSRSWSPSSAPCSTTPASRCRSCSTTAAGSSTRPRPTATRRSRCSTTAARCSARSRTTPRTSAPSPAAWRSSPRRCAGSDEDLRQVLQGTPGTARELNALLTDLEPTLPVLLSNVVSINQVVVGAPRRPRAAAGDLPARHRRRLHRHHRGRLRPRQPAVRLGPPCTEGYLPPSQWRAVQRPHRRADLPGAVPSGPPYNMRGSKYSPGTPLNSNPARASVGSYDPLTGVLTGAIRVCRRVLAYASTSARWTRRPQRSRPRVGSVTGAPR